MNLASPLCRWLLPAVLALGTTMALADSWAPPAVQTTASANGRFRVTIVPRGIKSPLDFFQDKADGKKLAGQREGDAQTAPLARVEQRDPTGQWQMRWQKPLVNDVGPTQVLIADDGASLVTFDNWHSVGFGDDVVVIYDRHGNLVRKLSLEQILPRAYVAHLPRSVSSRWWGKGHRLVEGDTQLELHVVEPGAEMGGQPKFVPVRLRLADGAAVPPGGAAWNRALALANKLEAKRLAAWAKVRAERIAPLSAPAGNDTHAWRHYMFEIRDRISAEEESIRGMVLAAPGADPGFHDAKSIAGWVDDYDSTDEYDRSFIFASPTSDRLAALLAKSLRGRRANSMKGAHIIFVGTPAEGRMLAAAAAKSGASVTLVDITQPVPAGKPLPIAPPPLWEDGSADF